MTSLDYHDCEWGEPYYKDGHKWMVADLPDWIIAEMGGTDILIDDVYHCYQGIWEDGVTLKEYRGEAESLILPNIFCKIYPGAFSNSTNLRKVTLPSSLEEIADSMFEDATLEAVVIPNSITKIGDNAFSHSRLVSIVIPDSVTSFGRGTFSTCIELETVILPNMLAMIPDFAFEYCGITNIVIPDSVITIGKNAFCGCGGMRVENIPDGVVHIGNGAFADCDALTEAVKECIGDINPHALKSIGDSNVLR